MAPTNDANTELIIKQYLKDKNKDKIKINTNKNKINNKENTSHLKYIQEHELFKAYNLMIIPFENL